MLSYMQHTACKWQLFYFLSLSCPGSVRCKMLLKTVPIMQNKWHHLSVRDIQRWLSSRAHDQSLQAGPDICCHSHPTILQHLCNDNLRIYILLSILLCAANPWAPTNIGATVKIIQRPEKEIKVLKPESFVNLWRHGWLRWYGHVCSTGSLLTPKLKVIISYY